MCIHCSRVDIPRAVEKICKHRSKAVFVIPMSCTEEESTRDWVASVDNMTLNKVVQPAGESVPPDAKDSLCHPRFGQRNSSMLMGAWNRLTPRI